MVGAEAAKTSDGGEILTQGIVRNPIGIVEIARRDWKRNRQCLVDDAPFTDDGFALCWRTHDIEADGNQVDARGIDHTTAEVVVVGEPDTGGTNLGGKL